MHSTTSKFASFQPKRYSFCCITSVSADGNSKLDFIFNYSLISHCERKKYNCIDLAKKLKGNVDHWSDKRHTTKEGSKAVANILAKDLIKIIKRLNLI